MGWMNAVHALDSVGKLPTFLRPRSEGAAPATMGDSTTTFGFTAYLHTNYRKPLLVTTPIVLIRAKVDRVEGRKKFLTATLSSPGGTLFADAESLFLLPRPREKKTGSPGGTAGS